MHVMMDTPTSQQKQTRRPSTKPCWLFDELSDNVSDDGSYLAASTTQVPVAENENPSESVTISTERPELTLSSFIVAEFDGQTQITTPLEQPTISIVGAEPPISSPVVAIAATPLEQQDFLHSIVDNVDSKLPELAFTFGYNGLDSCNPVLNISQRAVFDHPPFGMTSRIYVTIQYKHYKVHVMMRLWSEGEIKSIDDLVDLCTIFSRKSSYKFCPAIDPVYYDSEYHKVIHFHIKSVWWSTFPFSQVDSVNCKLWFLPASNTSVSEKAASEVKCPACKRLVHELNLQRKCTLAESPSRRIKRHVPLHEQDCSTCHLPVN